MNILKFQNLSLKLSGKQSRIPPGKKKWSSEAKLLSFGSKELEWTQNTRILITMMLQLEHKLRAGIRC